MLLSLWAIESDAAGTPPYLFVSSTNTDSVKRYDALTGAFVDDFVPPGSGGLRYTHALTFGPDGNLYVVSDGSNEVKRYNGVTGVFIDTFASGAGMFDPKEAQFGPDGNLYVSTGGRRSGEAKIRWPASTGSRAPFSTTLWPRGAADSQGLGLSSSGPTGVSMSLHPRGK